MLSWVIVRWLAKVLGDLLLKLDIVMAEFLLGSPDLQILLMFLGLTCPFARAGFLLSI